MPPGAVNNERRVGPIVYDRTGMVVGPEVPVAT